MRSQSKTFWNLSVICHASCGVGAANGRGFLAAHHGRFDSGVANASGVFCSRWQCQAADRIVHAISCSQPHVIGYPRKTRLPRRFGVRARKTGFTRVSEIKRTSEIQYTNPISLPVMPDLSWSSGSPAAAHFGFRQPAPASVALQEAIRYMNSVQSMRAAGHVGTLPVETALAGFAAPPLVPGVVGKAGKEIVRKEKAREKERRRYYRNKVGSDGRVSCVC